MSCFRILGITFSSELRFFVILDILEPCQFEQIQNHETIPIHPLLCLGFSGFNFVCVFASELLLLSVLDF
jgi:hypothetical protein